MSLSIMMFVLCLVHTLAFPGMAFPSLVLPGMVLPDMELPDMELPGKRFSGMAFPIKALPELPPPPLSSPPLDFLDAYHDTVRIHPEAQPHAGEAPGRRVSLNQVQVAAIDEWIAEIWADAYSEEELARASRRTAEIYEMLQHPLALNRASADELMNVPWISPEIALEIVRYRNEVKPYRKKDDLMHVRGIGLKTFSRIAPFVVVDPSFHGARTRYGNPRYWLHGIRSESLTHLRQTLEKQEGYIRPDSAGGYLGSPVQLYHRVRVQSDHLSVNLTLEKDAGEPLPSAFDFDYSSWHVALRETGLISSLVVGDFSVRYGQGLVVSSAGGMGKSGLGSGVIGKAAPVLRPWTSANEGGAFRGAGITLGRKIQFSGFVSSRLHTAGIHADSTYRQPGQTGLHRTLSERARKDRLRQTVVGAHLRYRNAVFEGGISALKVRYAHPVSVRSSPSSPFDFYGSGVDTFGADLRLSLSNWVMFAEVVTSASRNWNSPGYIVGFAIRQDQIRWAWLFRSYPAYQHSLLSSGFSESSSGSNELGTMMTLRYEPSDWAEMVLFTDHYQFPHARYQKYSPSSGWELSLTGIFKLFEGTKLSAGFRITEKQRDTIGIDELGRESRQTNFRSRWNYRFQAEWSRHPRVRFRIRADRIIAKTPDLSNGFLLFQDVRWAIFRFLQLDARLTFFDATSFDARLYQYETDLLYLMSNTVLSDKGTRFYIMTRFDVGRLIQFRFKVASTRYENRNSVGSGLQIIDGRQKTDIGAQLRIRF